tara:strand:+ start:427 stop:594 length:168 start_codon:yes stop_codon:yes gene_type:complete
LTPFVRRPKKRPYGRTLLLPIRGIEPPIGKQHMALLNFYQCIQKAHGFFYFLSGL